MNTSVDIIEIEQDEPATRAVPFLQVHRGLATALGIAAASGIVLTGCLALQTKHDTLPRPTQQVTFVVGKGRPWIAQSSASRRPSEFGKQVTSRSAAARPKFHLTFDDGPHPVHTPKILDWLKANDLHATFFLVGENVGRHPALVQRIVAEGHHVGNHTWSHPKLTVMSDTLVRDQIQRTHDAIVKACGQAPTVFRPPYGALSARQRAWIEKEFRYQTLLWDIDTLDWTQTTSTAIAARIQHGLKADSANVILAHDIHPRILPALESLLPKPILSTNNVAFVTVSK